MEAEGLVEESQQLKDLANLGYYMADINSQIEQASNDCSATSDPTKCFNDYLNGKNIGELPSNIEHLLPDYYKPTNKFEEFIYTTNVIDAFIISDKAESWTGEDAGHTFVDIYQNINNNDEISQSAKIIVENIYKTVYDLNYESWSKVNNIKTDKEDTVYWEDNPYYDPITGQLDPTNNYTTVADVESIGDPTTSVGTTFGSTIVCELGLYTVDNLACQ